MGKLGQDIVSALKEVNVCIRQKKPLRSRFKVFLIKKAKSSLKSSLKKSK